MPIPLGEGVTLGGRYKLVRKLAEGGMGEIWVAEHQVTHRQLAIKLLKPGHGESARRRAIKEAQAACAIDHPSVVPIHDVIDDPAGEPALVMDLLSGESLDAFRQRHGRFGPAEAARLLAGPAEALALAHGLGIVHRDLKPANLFVTKSGEVKILDFGIMKQVDGGAFDATAGTATAAGQLLGTPLYMSPEQAGGEPGIDARTDVWSFGLVLYETLTGVLPTRAPNFSALLKLLLTGHLKPITEYAPTLPPVLVSLVSRTLERDVEKRTITMAEVAATLRSFAAAAPVSSEDLTSTSQSAGDLLATHRSIPSGAKLTPTPATPATDGGSTPAPSVPQATRPIDDAGPPTAQLAPEQAEPRPGTTLPLPATSPVLPRIALAAVVTGAAVFGWWSLRAAPDPAPAPAPAPPKPTRVLTDPASTLGCTLFEAQGVTEPSGWLGAAASSVACRRMQWLLGGEADRVVPLPSLLDFPVEFTEDASDDPYAAPGLRVRSLAAASARTSATLDGAITRRHDDFRVVLRLLTPAGDRVGEAEGTGVLFGDAIEAASNALAKAGTFPRAERVAPAVEQAYGFTNPEVGWDVDVTGWRTNDVAGSPNLCERLRASGEAPETLLPFVTAMCPPLPGAPPRPPPELDRSSTRALMLSALRVINESTAPLADPAGLAAELEAAARKQDNLDLHADLMLLAEVVLATTDPSSAYAARKEFAFAHPGIAGWHGLFAPGASDPSATISRALTRAARAWAPFQSNDWRYAGLEATDFEGQTRWPRRAWELDRDPVAGLEFGRRAMAFGRTTEARDLAARLRHGGPDSVAAGTYLIVAVDGVEGYPARALASAERFLAALPAMGGSMAELRVLSRALLIAEVIGRDQGLADAWVERFVLGATPRITTADGSAIAQMTATCLAASAPKREPCLKVLDTLFASNLSLYPGGRAMVDGARAAAAGDPRGAVRAWRPLFHDMTLSAYLPIELLEAAGETEFARRIDEFEIARKANRIIVGYGPHDLRMVRRAAKAGDKAGARTLAKAMLAAWSAIDTEPAGLDELRKLAAD